MQLCVFMPALPTDWATGQVKGLKARGGITLDMTWKDGQVTFYRLTSPITQTVAVKVNGAVKQVRTEIN